MNGTKLTKGEVRSVLGWHWREEHKSPDMTPIRLKDRVRGMETDRIMREKSAERRAVRKSLTREEIVAALKQNGWADDGEGNLFKTIGKFRMRIEFRKTSLIKKYKMPWHREWQTLYLVGFDHVGLRGEFSGVKWWV